MNRTLRWILVAPCAFAAWSLVFLTLASYYTSLNPICDSDPGLPECQTMWYLLQKRYLPAVGAAISAIAVVGAVYLVAPTHKVRAAWVSCAIGTVVAAILSVGDQLAAVSAILAGLTIATFLSRRDRGSHDEHVKHVA